MKRIALAAAVILLMSGCTASSSYTAKIQSIDVTNSTQVSVTVKVTNTSGTADTPTCSIDILTNAGSELGSQSGQLDKSVKAGATTTAVLPVDVKSTQNVSKDNSSITCG